MIPQEPGILSIKESLPPYTTLFLIPKNYEKKYSFFTLFFVKLPCTFSHNLKKVLVFDETILQQNLVEIKK
jgi:hypothetical protein